MAAVSRLDEVRVLAKEMLADNAHMIPITLRTGFDINKALLLSKAMTMRELVTAGATDAHLMTILEDYDLFASMKDLSPAQQMFLHVEWSNAIVKAVDSKRKTAEDPVKLPTTKRDEVLQKAC